MNIEVLTTLPTCPYDKRNTLIIGTHNGIWHDDDTIALAILCALNENLKIYIVRTRDLAILKQCDICVDIGGGKYDHHQLGFDLHRPLGMPYASAGLVCLEIPSQTFPWVEAVVNINNTVALSGKSTAVINFVIFKYSDGGWAAQCVPPSLKESNKQRIPFPK